MATGRSSCSARSRSCCSLCAPRCWRSPRCRSFAAARIGAASWPRPKPAKTSSSDPARPENRQRSPCAGKTWYRINPLFPAGTRSGCAGSRPQALVLEPAVKVGDIIAVAVEDERRPALVAPDQLFRGLAPARVRHLRIDVRPEAVFGGPQRLPIALRPLIGEVEAHDRLDRLEAVFPRHCQTQRRALHFRYRLAVGAGHQKGELVGQIGSVKLKRTIDLIDLKPYFHGTARRNGAPCTFDTGLP